VTARAGKLVLVGTPLGNAGDLSSRAAQAIATSDVLACEDTRHTRKLLAVSGIQPKGRMFSLHQHNEQARAEQVVALVAAGKVVALVTDAGMPGVSDPGERVVRAVLDAGLSVETVPGPTAATTALALSGLPSERFCFEGFLPRKGRERKDRLAVIAGEARTSVLYEAPHRVVETVADLAAVCGGERRVAIARELTKLYEEVWRGTLADAVTYTEAVAPRGEYTLVVEGSADRPPASEDDIAEAVARHLAAGLTRKDAAAAVAEELGVPRRVAYEAANQAR
jgi:16S rRNA (cytidine1402-2'-O)-methyltransferase